MGIDADPASGEHFADHCECLAVVRYFADALVVEGHGGIDIGGEYRLAATVAAE